MVFSSLSFLFLFLPLLVIAYYTVPKKYIAIRKYILLFFSILFYASGESKYVFIMFACVYLTWLLSRIIEKRYKVMFLLAIFINLFPLFVFKYLGFTISNINIILGTNFKKISPIMPIGISFYTFQMLTYIVDLYKGKIPRQKNVWYLMLYIFFFPQLIAGPIVRYQDIENQINTSQESWAKIQKGVGRFIIGLIKKVLISNQVGYIVGTIMEWPLSDIPTELLWLAVLAYTMQIYFDFSGYSDMAIGLGALFGFNFPENFNAPYCSVSITDFWRRWHITLGTFFRDYVYIPLGGNKVSKSRWVFNVCIVWVLTGVWHGASWNFVVWGGYYAILLLFEKLLFKDIRDRFPTILKWSITFFLVMIGWTIFMCDEYSTHELFMFIARLFGQGEFRTSVSIRALGLTAYLPFLLGAIILSTPLERIFKKLVIFISNQNEKVFSILNDSILIIFFLLSIAVLVCGTYNPFIYFRF